MIEFLKKKNNFEQKKYILQKKKFSWKKYRITGQSLEVQSRCISQKSKQRRTFFLQI